MRRPAPLLAAVAFGACGGGAPVRQAAEPNGCLRAHARGTEALLERVPLGAPVFIRA